MVYRIQHVCTVRLGLFSRCKQVFELSISISWANVCLHRALCVDVTGLLYGLQASCWIVAEGGILLHVSITSLLFTVTFSSLSRLAIWNPQYCGEDFGVVVEVGWARVRVGMDDFCNSNVQIRMLKLQSLGVSFLRQFKKKIRAFIQSIVISILYTVSFPYCHRADARCCHRFCDVHFVLVVLTHTRLYSVTCTMQSGFSCRDIRICFHNSSR